ncbi:MAG: creatininase family protein [Pseudomonadota bacterium]
MAQDYLRLYAGLEGLGPSSVAILPLGAVETHGPHLPLGTDTLIAEALLDQALGDWPEAPPHLLRLPALWLGASGEHEQGRGTLSLEADATIGLIEAIGGQVARTGVQRLLLFNAHGGNVAVSQIAALNLRRQHGLLVASAHWLDFGLPGGVEQPSPPAEDVHGGWMETSLLLHLAPEVVRREEIADNPAQTPAPSLYPAGPVSWGWRTSDLVTGSWVGYPEAANAAIGAAMSAYVVIHLRRLLSDLAAADWPAAS